MTEIRGREKMGERRKEEDGKKTKMEWPPIKPKSNLKITRLKDTDLFTVQDFFTSVESKAFVKAAESLGFAHQGSLGPTKGEAYRDNDRVSVNDPVLANTIWESGLNKLFFDFKIRGKVAVGLNPNIRLYRYLLWKVWLCFTFMEISTDLVCFQDPGHGLALGLVRKQVLNMSYARGSSICILISALGSGFPEVLQQFDYWY
ncbi:hypothetical protein RHMOL_Rhmol03G0203100 [Rhododendron molle]|uniref:Uncharacterized protein n=1 Tax=Rhododendron molle TaxID=49168 RepID=A0ACC0PGM5_RHOML|nr:hypothetical protein RHMOL_Rhmol03G0203100 [Rhododendron molle]